MIGELYIAEHKCTLSYDTKLGVLKNGEPAKEWSPAFIGNEDDAELFGYESPDHKVVYDIYGGVSNVVSENSIKL